MNAALSNVEHQRLWRERLKTKLRGLGGHPDISTLDTAQMSAADLAAERETIVTVIRPMIEQLRVIVHRLNEVELMGEFERTIPIAGPLLSDLDDLLFIIGHRNKPRLQRQKARRKPRKKK